MVWLLELKTETLEKKISIKDEGKNTNVATLTPSLDKKGKNINTSHYNNQKKDRIHMIYIFI